MKSVVCRAAYLMASLMAAAGLAASTASADPPKTIEPGKLNIAMNGDMPMTQLKDGVLSGTDGSLMTMIAKQLGLQPVVHQMDWAGAIRCTTQGTVAGRLDMAILDPPLVQYAIKQHPEWKLHQVPLDPEADKYPIMSTKYNVIFGVNKNEPELAEAINVAILQMWKDCTNVKSMAEY